MTKIREEDILAEVPVSPPRRAVLLVVLYLLGAILVGSAFTSSATFVGRVILLLVGAFILFQAEKQRRMPGLSIQLTREGLFQSDGALIAEASQFRSVDRGALAIKPSNGFTINLHDKHDRAWVPGLWWRLGRRVGVGGTASAGAARFMAEQVAAMIKPQP